MVSDFSFVTIQNVCLSCDSHEVMTVKFCNHGTWYEFCFLCIHIKLYDKEALLFDIQYHWPCRGLVLHVSLTFCGHSLNSDFKMTFFCVTCFFQIHAYHSLL